MGVRPKFYCEVTPEEARVVWESMKRPSGGKVSAHFKSLGKSVDQGTILRWFKHGWVKGTPGAKNHNPLKQMEKLLPLLLSKSPQEVYADLAKGSLEQDVHEAVKQAQLDMVLLLRSIIVAQAGLVQQMAKTNPEGLAALIKATSVMSQTVHATYHKFSPKDMKTIEPIEDDDDNLKDALAAWDGASKSQ